MRPFFLNSLKNKHYYNFYQLQKNFDMLFSYSAMLPTKIFLELNPHKINPLLNIKNTLNFLLSFRLLNHGSNFFLTAG